MTRRPAMKLGLSISLKNLEEFHIREYDKEDVTAGYIPDGYALVNTEIELTDEYEIDEEGEDGEPETLYFIDTYRLYLLKIKTASHGRIKYLLGFRPDGGDFITFFKDVLEWDGVVPECLRASRLNGNCGTLSGSELHASGAWPKYQRDTTDAEDDFVNRCYLRVKNESDTLVEHFRKHVLTDRLFDDIIEFLRPDGAR